MLAHVGDIPHSSSTYPLLEMRLGAQSEHSSRPYERRANEVIATVSESASAVSLEANMAKPPFRTASGIPGATWLPG